MSVYIKSVVTAKAKRIDERENMLSTLSEIRHDALHICNNCGDSFYNESGYNNRFLAALSDFLIFDVRKSIPETPRERSPSNESV